MSTAASGPKSTSPKGAALPIWLWVQGPTSSLLWFLASGVAACWLQPAKHLKPSCSRLSYQPLMNRAGAETLGYCPFMLYELQKSSNSLWRIMSR